MCNNGAGCASTARLGYIPGWPCFVVLRIWLIFGGTVPPSCSLPSFPTTHVKASTCSSQEAVVAVPPLAKARTGKEENWSRRPTATRSNRIQRPNSRSTIYTHPPRYARCYSCHGATGSVESDTYWVCSSQRRWHLSRIPPLRNPAITIEPACLELVSPWMEVHAKWSCMVA